MTQPEALRLAEILEEASFPEAYTASAAAELRRLHAESELLRSIVDDFPPGEAELREMSYRVYCLESQRDALLEALRDIAKFSGEKAARERARAAITKAEGETE